MLRKELLTARVFKHIYPKPTRGTHPMSWNALVKELHKEIMQDLSMFYGGDFRSHLESRYAGMDYSYLPHRRRLIRWHYHARLFKAFDELCLTAGEINELCIWEGTLADRRRYEGIHGIIIRDTTGDCVARPWVDVSLLRAQRGTHAHEVVSAEEVDEDEEEDEEYGEEDDMEEGEEADAEPKDDVDMQDDEADDSDGELHSIGHDLNRRLLAAAAARENGVNAHFDAEFEQWLARHSQSNAAGEQLQTFVSGYNTDYTSNASHAFRASFFDPVTN